MNLILSGFAEAFDLLLKSSVYMLFGLLISGILRVFMRPTAVARHLGRGRFGSVFKAALAGIPIPLCSCGVLPAAVSLKKQGATKGATTAFLISTPESGVDSIAATYALLDPLMTVIRPVAAFVTAAFAGILANVAEAPAAPGKMARDLSCPVDNCCDGLDCPPEIHARHHSLAEKFKAGLGFAFNDVWQDLAGWFFIGLFVAGFITALVPDAAITQYLGGGLPAMLLMLAAGIPLYICATGSTPIAAALILKGVSPGAALVFLMAGPATNLTSLTVIFGVLGKRATSIYLGSIAVMAVGFGLLTDWLYGFWGISAGAVIGQAAELIPHWLQWGAALVLVLISIRPFFQWGKTRIGRLRQAIHTPNAGGSQAAAKTPPPSAGCTKPT